MNLDRYYIFREVTERICGDLNIEAALENCMKYLETIMPVDYMYMAIINENWPSIRLIAFVSRHHEGFAEPYDFMPLSKTELDFIRGINLGKAHLFNKISMVPYMKKAASFMGMDEKGSNIHMRTTISGQYTGSVGAISLEEGRYTPEHVAIFEELHKPFAIALSNTLHHEEVLRLKEQIQNDQQALFKDINAIVGDKVVGARSGLQFVMDMVNQVAPLESPVLLLGETGCGKEVIARYLHNHSPRSQGPFIKVDCGSIPENLVESELFGHEKGAFTGAVKEFRGRFERAAEGTIFLDEIGELDISIQVKLLRVLQDKQFERVGGAQSINSNVRVIAATHRNLESMVRKGEFREDLWYRLNVFPIFIPPLRERKNDIPELVNHLVRRLVREMNLPEIPKLGPAAIDQLMAYDWPGNVRELQNIIERAMILSNNRPLSFPGLMSDSQNDRANKVAYKPETIQPLNAVMRDHIVHVLNVTHGKIGGEDGAARILDIEPNTLRARMRKLGIPYGRNVKRQEKKSF